LAGFLLIFSLAVTRYMLHRARIMDVPRERSSHNAPTPTCGGISIVAAFIVGVAAIFIFADSMMIMKRYFLGFVLSALLIAGISLYDDIKDKPLHH
jgi:UDP-GlcNAc:undecaprenyl-phosphate/decaprenyl-phosphate GlcNAc-1-phosphate transferase